MDIINVLADEHRRLMTFFERFDEAKGMASKEQLVLQMIQELSIHEESEEVAVWSAIRNTVPGGVLEQAIQEEIGLKDALETFVVEFGQSDLVSQIGRFKPMVLQHVETERNRIFPLIEQHLDQARRDQLGDAYMRAKNNQVERMAQLDVIMAPETPVDQASRS